jgi:hypothetical protein
MPRAGARFRGAAARNVCGYGFSGLCVRSGCHCADAISQQGRSPGMRSAACGTGDEGTPLFAHDVAFSGY